MIEPDDKANRLSQRPVKQSASALLILITLLSLNGAAQQWKSAASGVEHAELRRTIDGKPVDIDLLRLDLSKVRIDVKHAGTGILGTETTSSIARRAGAVAAVNAGFFRLDTSKFAGDPVGLFVVDGKPLSEQANDRIQMLINNTGARSEVRFGRSNILHGIRVGDQELSVSGVNRERKAEDIVMYTPEFGATTLTDASGIEIVVVRGIITVVGDGVGNAVIPKNGFVLSVAGAAADALRSAAKVSATAFVTKTWNGLPAEFEKDRDRLDVVTGVPQLVRAGQVEITWEQERSSRAFVETRHPRTAVARLRDGRLLLITADGRTEESAGLGLNDLATLLVELGAVEAINLDGGGSTTMYVNGKLVNKPSDKEGERKVSDALVITRRRSR